jgi:hypothetical protein
LVFYAILFDFKEQRVGGGNKTYQHATINLSGKQAIFPVSAPNLRIHYFAHKQKRIPESKVLSID